MFIVAIDTSGRNGSVALCSGDSAGFELLGMAVVEGGTYSARLVPCIGELLQAAGLRKTQIEGFVVVDGPGSFTGLRVGLSTAKALCEALKVPLATVSMLEALAETYGKPGDRITSVLDAGRGEVYVGEFRVADNCAELLSESIVKADELLSRHRAPDVRIVTTHSKLGSEFLVEPLRADAIARIGLRKLLAAEVANHIALDANYIRRSDAELFALPK